jgi:soluble lytic murein transglycosylase-like protein
MPTLKNDFDDLIWQASQDWDVPFVWIKAVIGTESDFNPNAYRAEPKINDASRGLMQLLYRTAKGLGYTGDPDGLYDPFTNIQLGAKFLADLRDTSGDDFKAVYSAYNSGNPRNYLTNPDVAAHVNRAQSYLDAVNAVTAQVTYDPSEDGSIETVGTATGLIIAAIGLGLFFIMKPH